MSSNKSKPRASKNVKPKTRKKGLIYSKDDEENAANSNAVTTYRGYNLRSCSPSRVQQLSSKEGNYVNTDCEFLKNENPNKLKRNDAIIDKQISKEVYSPINDKNDIYSPLKKSYKMGKNFTARSQIPKCLPLPAPEAKNTGVKSKEKSFDITNTLVPYKSVLKRDTVSNSPMKHPHLADMDQKDIIKERIFGPTEFRQKKVQFKTISCYNLNCGNVNSKDLEDAAIKIPELNIPASEDVNNEEKRIIETVSMDKNGGSIPAHIRLQNEEAGSSKKSFEAIKKINVNKNENSLTENTRPSQECKDHYIQTNTNTLTNPDETLPMLGLFSQNYIKDQDADYKTYVLNEQEILKENPFAHNTYNSGEKVENLKILRDLKTAESSLENKTFWENKIVENSEVLQTDTRHEDHGKKSNLMKGNILNFKEEKHLHNKATLNKETNKNSMNTILSPISTPKTHDQSQENHEQAKSKDLFKNEVEDRVKDLTAQFLQEIEVKRNIKKKRRRKKSNRNGRSTIYDECNVLQATTGGVKEDFVQSPKEKGTNLFNSFKPSNSDDSSTSQKVFTFQQEPIFDFNQSNFRSPKHSKIPRLMQNLDNAVSPLGESDSTPMKTKEIIGVGVAQNQSNINCVYDSENKAKKTQDLNETMLTADTSRFSKEQEIDSLVEDEGTISDSSYTSFGICCDQEDNIMPVKNESFPDIDANNISRTNEDEFKLVDNINTSLKAKNNDSKVIKETLITADICEKGYGIQREAKVESYTAMEAMINEIYEQSDMEESCSNKNKAKVVEKTPVLRTKKSNTGCIYFTIICFLCAVIYVLLLQILEYPSCDT